MMTLFCADAPEAHARCKRKCFNDSWTCQLGMPVCALAFILVAQAGSYAGDLELIQPALPIIEHREQQLQELLQSFSLSYEWSMLTQDETSGKLEETMRNRHRLTVYHGSWRLEIPNARATLPDGTHTNDNSLTEVFHELRRKRLTMPGRDRNGMGNPTGRIQSEDVLHNSINFFFFHAKGPDGEPLSEYLRNNPSAVRDVVTSPESLTIRVFDEEHQKYVEYVMAPDQDFSITSMSHFTIDGVRLRTQDVEYTQVAEGVWLPVSARVSSFSRDHPEEHVVREIVLEPIDLNAFEFGKDYDASLFDIEFPVGTAVIDTVSNINYMVGGVGDRSLDALKGTPTASEIMLTDAPSGAVDEGRETVNPQVEGLSQSVKPSNRRTLWLVAAILLVGATIVGLLVVGRLVKRGQPT